MRKLPLADLQKTPLNLEVPPPNWGLDPRPAKFLSPARFGGAAGRFFRSARSRFLIFLIFIVILSWSMAPATLQAKSKTHWKRGMWIGALGGAVVGGTTFAIIGGKKCDRYNTDFDICGSGGATLLGVGGALAFGLVGMGIGTIIGVSIKKEEPVVLAPVISIKENQTYGGLSLTKSF
ncbi:MAG: hypothetical protein A3F82_06800 [Deltaproteobacteria bacterium RIFCSPLOWO2_12_FULL_44_12]|nr:MAG: hypothetical protein A2712_09635 [Deltaproteobacteria bacterium RIFCSPHIGHO2_01_FULL_43_49]OGQ14922.1 MAG: hypothetical protein A3D22_00050 [Deltaproteobacteria bacterium RIFCSPHIGHO2_02_FULL_44_53]OGQ29574.1 MAG: hypothetical protein A3D98_10365 [Deltaproteobacteria bacterium RIFCSPHIGHO2_12_FULL_44_21]OGQ31034.1 MAG: hypothetical protein A2979_06340 [Deltaproteobacteria bacterium RIFCSPLOWO2_01_FULL_45_74]OGQ42636.1 MAG: hypothetical protein A3I70_02010 [Deltaproteobacteria bacterium 